MALSDTAKLIVDLSLKGNYVSALGKAISATEKFDTKASRSYRAGQQIGTGIKRGAAIAAVGVGILASQVALGLRSLVELEQQTAQTEAVIKSTGGVAGVTADQVRALAEQYESLNATVGDEVIQSGENLLLTFTNIGKKGFEPALAAALDMNTALGKGPDGLTGTIKAVGRALNDPSKGLALLTRQGITFTDAQKKRILGLQKEGKLYEAQQVILGELNKRFGGSFLAQGNTTAGKVAKFNDAIEDLQRSLATALLPTVSNVADALSDLLRDPQVIRDVEHLGEEIGNLFSRENIAKGIDLLKSAVGTIRAIAGPIAEVIGTAVKAFTSLPPDIQKLLVGGFAVNKLTGGLVSNIAGGVFGALKAMTVQAGVVNVSGGVVKGGGAGAPGAGGGTSKVTTALAAASILADIIGVLVTQQQVSGESSAHASDVHATSNAQLVRGASAAELKTALSGVEQGIKDLKSNPLFVLVQGDALTQLEQMRAEISAALTTSGANPGKARDDLVPATKEGTQAAARDAAKQAGLISRVQASVDAEKAATVAGLEGTKSATNSVGRDARDAGTRAAGSTDRASGNIVAAIHANRPIITTNVNVTATTVTKSVTVQNRSGGGGTSRNRDPGHPGATAA